MVGFFSQQFQEQKKMENQTGYLFTLELRIRKQIVKLNVYEEDSLNDLIKRLSKTVQYKEKYTERLREKLEAEFKKLIRTQECSRKVKSKLESLTEESKLIIIGVSESEKNEQSLNETPFKILLETSSNARKPLVDNIKKQYNYENNGSPLIRKYNKPPNQERNYQIKQQVPLKYNYSNEKYPPNGYNLQQEKSNIKEYSPIANINSKRSMKSNSNQHENRMQLDIIAEEEERIRKEGCIRKFNALQEKMGHYEVRDFNPKESFQDYKIQKNKSQSFIGRPSAFDAIKRGYISNQDEPILLRGQNKLTYHQHQEALTKIDYSSKQNLYRIDYGKQAPSKLDYFPKQQQLTKIDYSAKYLQNKAAATAGGRANKKFSYLSQANF